MSKFKENYTKKIVPELMKELKIENINIVPRITKVCVNVGIGTYLKNNKDFSIIEKNLELITGQKPVVSMARKSISNFKLREETPNGIKVTIRDDNMYEFINKLVNVVLPRVRDFRGISNKAFDKKGNYSLGIKEHTVFPEALIDDQVKAFSLQVNIITNTNDDKLAFALLSKLGFPFQKK